MQRLRYISAILLLCGSAAAAAGLTLELPEQIPDEPFDFRAGRFEFTNDTFIAEGGVTGRFENITIQAGRASGNQATGELLLEGAVRVERGNLLWQGEKLNFNYKTQTGDFGPSTLDFEPVLLRVDEVQRVSTNEYLLAGVSFTTCTNHPAHFHVRAEKARLVDGEYLQAHGVGVYVGNVPIFYVPYWYQKLNNKIWTFQFGYSSEWGPYSLIRATVPVTREVDWVSDFNLYGKRGLGLAQGLNWDFDDAAGLISGFYINDQDPHSRFDEPPEVGQIGAERYRIKFEHLQHFSDDHYLNTKWNYQNDPALIEEFFKPEYKDSRQPENFASWVHGGGLWGSEAFASKSLTDFYDNVDRAEYSADLYRTRLGPTPFYLQSEHAVAHLERVYSETNEVASAYDAVRLDSYNALLLPQRFGALRIVPRATWRGSYYSKTTDSDRGELRQIPGAGMEVSVAAAKVLSEEHRWYGKGLRHKIEPYADYIYEQSTVDSDALLQFDWVDELDDENKVKLGLRNVLQTRRNGRLARFVDLDLYTHYLIDKEDDRQQDFDRLYLDARMPLTEHARVDLEGEYDWYSGSFEFFNARASYAAEEVEFSLGHLYRRAEMSLWTPRVRLYPEGNVSLEAYARYDDNANELEEITLMGFKNFCCMRYGLGLRFYDDSEFKVMLSIGLSAFPELGF